MKKLIYLMALITIGFVSCETKTEKVPVDLEAEKAAVSALIDNLYAGIKAQDIDTLAALFSEDLLAIGSDPSEFWNKQEIVALWGQMISETSPEINFISEKVVKIAPDGNSAVAVVQYFVPMFSATIPFRSDYHLIKSNGEWKIFVSNVALIPKNEDIQKLNDALKITE
jgi:ketosteroid isomerase-like protein